MGKMANNSIFWLKMINLNLFWNLDAHRRQKFSKFRQIDCQKLDNTLFSSRGVYFIPVTMLHVF